MFYSPEYDHLRACICAKPLQLCLTLCDPVDDSLSDSSVHGIFQAKILKWVAMWVSMPSSRRRSWPRDQTHVSCVSRIAGRFCTAEPWGTNLVNVQCTCYVHSLDVDRGAVVRSGCWWWLKPLQCGWVTSLLCGWLSKECADTCDYESVTSPFRAVRFASHLYKFLKNGTLYQYIMSLLFIVTFLILEYTLILI